MTLQTMVNLYNDREYSLVFNMNDLIKKSMRPTKEEIEKRKSDEKYKQGMYGYFLVDIDGTITKNRANGSQLKEVKRATTNVRVSNKLQSPFNFF